MKLSGLVDGICIRELAMMSDPNRQEESSDHIIEVSILKIRRMQIVGCREERQRLLVMETLHQGIAQKVGELEAAGRVSPEDRIHTFQSILQEALHHLGLARILRFCVSQPTQSGELPRIKLPNTRKNNANLINHLA